MKINQLFLGIAIFSTFSVMAQKGVDDGSQYGKGEDSAKCVRNFSLYRSYYQQNAYDDALLFWRGCFEECPKVSKNLYIHGVKMFKDKIDKTTDASLKRKYIDTLSMVYLQRIKYYKEEGENLSRLGSDLIRYVNEYPELATDSYNALSKSISILGNSSDASVIAFFMTASVEQMRQEKIDANKALEDYEVASKILDAQLAKKPTNETLLKAKEHIDQEIVKASPSCEKLTEIFQAQFKANPNDVALLNKIQSVLDKLKCHESAFYYEVVQSLIKNEPSARTAALAARLANYNKEYDKATEYFLQAIELETEAQTKARLYMQLADISLSQFKDFPKTRSYARKAIELDNTNGKPYLLIATLYATTKDCTADDIQKSAIYWIAVDYYKKAMSVDPSLTEDAQKAINLYQQYYPTKEAIFFQGLNNGNSYTVGCWINEATIIRAR